MKNLKIKSLLLFLMLSTSAYSNVLIPNNQCALIVASRTNITEVKNYINDEVSNKKYVNVYISNNGWYAISIGFLKNNNAKSILKKWKISGKIPQDSFCAKAHKFTSEVNLNSTTTRARTTSSTQTNTQHKTQQQSPNGGIDVCQYVSGASVLANDGKYLGKISSEYASESIFNEYGTYGSEYSSDSIWNEYGSYGGKYASNSPFNSYSSTPPVLVKNGKAITYLSVNKSLRGAINPYFLKTCTFY